jgi:hypothetical protein
MNWIQLEYKEVHFISYLINSHYYENKIIGSGAGDAGGAGDRVMN